MSIETMNDGPTSPADVSHGYDQCWYPLDFSSRLQQSDVRSYDLCDGRVVAYRGDDGAVRVMTAYCRHLGADLGVGAVVGNDVQCAFHHWRFGEGGVCTGTASGDRVPASAKLFQFPVREAWDLIWVFTGPEPLYDVPHFDGFDASELYVRTFEVPMPGTLPIPPAVFGSNVFDFQHLQVLHHLEIDPALGEFDMGDHYMAWKGPMATAEAGRFDARLKVWGTNCASIATVADGVPMSIGSGSPQGPRGTRMFMTLGLPIQDGSPEELERINEIFAVGEAMHTRIVNEDYPILTTIRFREDTLVSSDKALARFFRYQRDYPKFSIASVGGS